MLPLSASIVLFKSDPADLTQLFEALRDSDLQEWIVVDNGAAEYTKLATKLQACVSSFGGRYIAAPKNLGFGAGHNLALTAQARPAEFHVMLNPDILFEPAVFEILVNQLATRPAVGLIMPKVLYADGTFQPVCKLLPTPADFALRRFAPAVVRRLFRKRLEQYELEGIELIECDRVPFLSGCFLFARRSVLSEVGGFDDRFFLYLEDVDLCRRMAQCSKLLYWPHASVIHICYRGAYRSTKLMTLFLRSAVAYFNKWGWLFDATRSRANRDALTCVSRQTPR